MLLPTVLAFSFGLGANTAAAAVVHYPPKSTNTNNLTWALTGTGAPGIFNSSTTLNNQYGSYNWCNMPHVRSREYKTPANGYTLQYVEVIQRHHKRTSYASNTFFKEDVTWSCAGQGPVYGARSSSGSGSQSDTPQWQAYTDPQNPWTTTVGPGFVNSTCQFPQITSEGLEDAIQHGSDLRSVYASRLGLSSTFDPAKVKIRVTNNVITSQVASGLLRGLFPSTSPTTPLEIFIQSSTFDSLEPTYSCPVASNLKTAYTTGSSGSAWQDHLTQAQGVYAQLDAVSGIASADTAGWHVSFDHYYDNLSAKQCHSKSLPCSLNATSTCVSQTLANTVYRLGQWEYSYQFRDAPDSARYAALNYGAWVLEMRERLRVAAEGSAQLKYYHNIAHDGSISPLLGFLQIAEMVWPGMGSEVVFELYTQPKTKKSFVRVLWSGQPMETSTPLGVLDMVPLDDFFAYIDSMIGSGKDLYAACTSS